MGEGKKRDLHSRQRGFRFEDDAGVKGFEKVYEVRGGSSRRERHGEKGEMLLKK